MANYHEYSEGLNIAIIQSENIKGRQVADLHIYDQIKDVLITSSS